MRRVRTCIINFRISSAKDSPLVTKGREVNKLPLISRDYNRPTYRLSTLSGSKNCLFEFDCDAYLRFFFDSPMHTSCML